MSLVFDPRLKLPSTKIGKYTSLLSDIARYIYRFIGVRPYQPRHSAGLCYELSNPSRYPNIAYISSALKSANVSMMGPYRFRDLLRYADKGRF